MQASSSSSPFRLGLLPFSLLIGVTGCPRGEVSEIESGPTPEELVGFYSPKSIKILEFTKPQSFDDDLIPDGLKVWLRPRDGDGDELKAFGTFIFELYAYRPASQNRKGQLIQQWKQPVLEHESQRQFWNRITRAYEFHLSWEGEPIPPQKKYILAVSFQSGPGSERLFDAYEFEFRINRDEILEAMSEPS
ncbi:MAG: hypothetical protein MI923_07380 [Phycisphaerales bacterium]|nr:hypothetical protein [Phycisphaerales bacterium]